MRCFWLVVGTGTGPFFGAGGVLFEALLGDQDGVRHLLGGSPGEGAIEAGNVDASVAHLRLDGGVHGGEEFIAELVEDAVDVEVGQQWLR